MTTIDQIDIKQLVDENDRMRRQIEHLRRGGAIIERLGMLCPTCGHRWIRPIQHSSDPERNRYHCDSCGAGWRLQPE